MGLEIKAKKVMQMQDINYVLKNKSIINQEANKFGFCSPKIFMDKPILNKQSVDIHQNLYDQSPLNLLFEQKNIQKGANPKLDGIELGAILAKKLGIKINVFVLPNRKVVSQTVKNIIEESVSLDENEKLCELFGLHKKNTSFVKFKASDKLNEAEYKYFHTLRKLNHPDSFVALAIKLKSEIYQDFYGCYNPRLSDKFMDRFDELKQSELNYNFSK